MNKDSNSLTPELFNRVSIWEEALGKAYNYLLSIDELKNFSYQEEGYVIYQMGERKTIFHKGITINQALLEAAVVNFISIFSSGYSGNMIAGQKDPEIINLQNKLVEISISQLKWTRNEFDEFLEKVKNPRDKLLAHYDGDAGDYKDITDGLSSRKMVGIHLLDDDTVKLSSIVKVMRENVFKMAYGI